MENAAPNVRGSEYPYQARGSPEPMDLFGAIWSSLSREGATIITLRHGQSLVHGMAFANVVSCLGSCPWQLLAVAKPDEKVLTCNFTGLIIIGPAREFGDPALKRTLSAAGYPTRFEILEYPTNGHPHAAITSLFNQCGPDCNTAAASQPDIGFVLAGVTRDLLRAPMILISGTTSLGITAASVWVTDRRSLMGVPVPPTWREHPLEAMVRLAGALGDGGGRVVRGDIVTEALACGTQYYNEREARWVTSQPEKVRLISDALGRPTSIIVGQATVRARPNSDLFRMLWLLAERSAKNLWTTIDELTEKLERDIADPRLIQHKRATYKSRILDIKKLSAAPNFCEGRDKPRTREKEYRLNAKVMFERLGDVATCTRA